MAAAYDLKLLTVFPKGTIRERRMLKLLKKAYVDARYNEDYSITKKELEWLGKSDCYFTGKEEILMSKKILQHILGYVIGGLIVLYLIPSALIYIAGSLDHLIGIQLIPFSGLRYIISVVLLVIGLLFALWSIIIQNIVGKGGPLEVAGLEVSPKTQNLVVTGPYRYTRNPMLFRACIYQKADE